MNDQDIIDVTRLHLDIKQAYFEITEYRNESILAKERGEVDNEFYNNMNVDYRHLDIKQYELDIQRIMDKYPNVNMKRIMDKYNLPSKPDKPIGHIRKEGEKPI